MPQVRYSAEVRQRALSLVLDSKLPVAQVARDLGCSVYALHSWLKKHRQQGTPLPESFVPISIVDSPVHSVDIILPNGITLRLTDPSPQSLAALVHALAPC